jgi:copper(I)-binding protein
MMALAMPAFAQVIASEGWVRGVVAGQTTAAAFMQLKADRDLALVGVSTPVARVAEVHAMQFESGMMKMRAVDRLPLRAGKAIELKPGGHHVMLMGLARTLRDGDTVPLTLQFEDRSGKKWPLQVSLPVRAPTALSNAPPAR